MLQNCKLPTTPLGLRTALRYDIPINDEGDTMLHPIAQRIGPRPYPVQEPCFQPKFGTTPTPDPGQQRMAELATQYPVIKRMFDLIDIPSATPQKDPRYQGEITRHMERVKALVIQSFRQAGVTNIEQNPQGSLIIRVPGSPGYENARPLMLTAHMDIVPGDINNPTRPINRQFKAMNGREFITSDGTTTLGADDKGGLAMILDNVARLRDKPHAPLEIILSPDEESSCDSLKTLDTSQFKAKNVLVVDEFYDFQVTNGLASAVMIDVSVTGTNGGHSGDDINKPNRLNAILLLSNILKKLGTGVIADHPNHPGLPLISKNLGLIQGGSAANSIPESASATLMLRSFDRPAQERELARIQTVLKNAERYYKATQPNLKITMQSSEEYPPWQGDPNSPLLPLCKQASREMGGPEVQVKMGHAAAQASILANKTNANGDRFDAVLIGPHIEEAHTCRERIDWKTLVQANNWLGNIIELYTRQAASKSSS